MAEAPGHRLGQIIGTVVELAAEPFLAEIADEFDVYLDKHGKRPARSGSKLTWTDSLGNKHDLDYVIERGGTDEDRGVPVAFIESAWRRYTKHSRNKAQEIQGAILPLLATHSESKPFAGVVLAGVFTQGSLDQLRSNNFCVLHIPYEDIIKAFGEFKIDVQFDESTSDEHLRDQIKKFEALKEDQLNTLAERLRATVPREFKAFAEALRESLGRRVTRVYVVPLHGKRHEYKTVGDAIDLVRGYSGESDLPLERFEIQLKYSNGDRIEAEFAQADEAIRFLETFSS